MSNYGADENPDLNIATDIVFVQGLIPLKKVNVMQWTHPDNISVQKFAHRKTNTNLLILFDRS